MNGFQAIVEKTPLIHKAAVPVAHAFPVAGPAVPVAHAFPVAGPAVPTHPFPVAGPAVPFGIPNGPFGAPIAGRVLAPATRLF